MKENRESQTDAGFVTTTLSTAPASVPQRTVSTCNKRKRRHHKGTAACRSFTIPVSSEILIKIFLNRIDNNYITIPGRFLYYEEIRRDMLEYFDLQTISENYKKPLFSLLKSNLKLKFKVPSHIKDIKSYRFPITFPLITITLTLVVACQTYPSPLPTNINITCGHG